MSFTFHTDCVLYINISKFGKVSKSSKNYFHPLTKQASRNEQYMGFHAYLSEELQEGGYHRNPLTPPPLPQPHYQIYSQTAELKRCKNIASELFYCLNILSKAVRDFDCAAYSKRRNFRVSPFFVSGGCPPTILTFPLNPPLTKGDLVKKHTF